MDELGKTSPVGRKLAHYRISTVLGAGGMGQVYRATDTKLGRDVALKVLPSDMASDPDRLARFQREARAVAALNHPNVVTVYSVEEADNVHFITMELIEGQPLDHLITSDGLPLERIVEIAGALAEALAAAHEKSILHRDLKPANVMVTNDGRVKVLDFGLAKDVGAKASNDATLTSAGHTQAGIVMGTPAYMSPEQVAGRALDHRTDIFSLGVMLHEMATGRRPFEGSSSAELISSILRDNPPSVTDARPELPSDLARVIRRCLEKDPRHRMQTARDVSNEFRDMARTVTRPAAVPAVSARVPIAADSGTARADEGFWVAVLPFKYAGGNADLKALAEGLSEEVITGLSHFSYLRVIGRGSTAKYSSESGDVRTIGKELGARYVMEGSLRQAGSKLRLAVQLVDAVSGAHLWAATYERSFTPEAIFELQDDLAPRIVSTAADMHGVLPRSMAASVRLKPSDQLTPYEALLRGFGHSAIFRADDVVEVQSCLERAVQQSPGNADCLAMLSAIQTDAYGVCDDVSADILEKAHRSAQAAVEAASTNALSYHALAKVFFFKRNLPAFCSAAERAIALNPMDGATIAYMGILIAFAGDWERGTALTEKGMQLNANHPGWHLMTAWHDAYRRRDYPKALELALKLNAPKNPWVQRSLTVSYAQLGRQAEARNSLRDLLALVPNYSQVAREMHARWLEPELVEHMLEGLRKAGLEIRDEDASAATLASGSVATSTSGSAATSTAITSATAASATASGATRADEGFWVAVLPFKYSGANAEIKALAEGLSEEVITGLSRFSYLRVIARGSTARYSSESDDVRAIGKELGARYVMEGSLRQAGNKLRLGVQIVDAVSGTHLWAENYERTYRPESIFALQDDLVPRIVSTVADQNGILPRRISEELRVKNEEDLTPHEAVLRAFTFLQRISPTEHATARRILERAVERDPNQADAWAMLAIIYDTEFADEYNPLPNPLQRAMAAAQRAVDLAPTHALGYYALAFTYFFRKDNAGFHAAVEQAIALNPMDGSVLGLLGLLVHHVGEIERGTQMVEAAMQLNPHYPPVFRAPAFLNAYAQGKYAEALELAVRFNMPGFFHAHALRAAALGQLGQREAGQQAVQELLAVRPDFATTVRRDYGIWWDAETVDHLIEGLRKAGLEIADDLATLAATKSGAIASVSGSGTTRADEGFWVAVLPFKCAGSNEELKALAEGMSDEVITGLLRFSYLRVIARSSSARYAGQAVDIRTAGKELNARYVMEGTLRQAGTKIRLAVQLVDALTGAHLWAETYERGFSAEGVFELQDDLVPRIVSTVADYYGILPHAISEALRRKPDEQLSPHEAVLRTFSYFERVTAAEHARVRHILENAVRSAPDQGEIWAMLSTVYWHEYAMGFNPQPDSLERALAAARRSVDAAPTNSLGYSALAAILFFQKNILAFREAAERAIELNPLDGSNLAHVGTLIAESGDWEHGCALVESALKLNPHHPGWYWFAHFLNAYRKADYRGALSVALKFNLSGFFFAHALTAAVYGQLGMRGPGQKALQELLAIRPDFAASARKEFEKFYDLELVEQLIEGLRKAGLEVRDGLKQAPSEAVAARSSVAPSIAVLPFANMSDDKEQDYFSDGLAEEIINLLAQIPGLKVIARTSAFAFRGKEQDIRGIAEALGVSTVLEGSVRRSGSRIRVTAQLINATDGSHLWSERYDRAAAELFAMQDEIASAIARELKLKFNPDRAGTRRRQPNLQSYESYLRYLHHQWRFTPDSLRLSRECLEKAIALDPEFALPYAGLADHHLASTLAGARAHEVMPKARDLALRALEADPDLPEGHGMLGIVAGNYELNWKEAQRRFQLAMARTPVPWHVRQWYFYFFLLAVGREIEALEEARRTLEDDPLSQVNHMALAQVAESVGMQTEAHEGYTRALELDPNFWWGWWCLGLHLAVHGAREKARECADRASAIFPPSPLNIGVSAALLEANEPEKAESLLSAVPGDDAGKARFCFYLVRRDIDEAVHCAESLVSLRDPVFFQTAVRPYQWLLRQSSGWPSLIKKMNLA